jgi:hypothetical protein
VLNGDKIIGRNPLLIAARWGLLGFTNVLLELQAEVLEKVTWPSLISRWRIHFREARLRDLDLDDSRKRGHVDIHLEFLYSSNSPPPTAAFPAL